jgi:N6-adenosine-specific RNA methylase IME4
VTQNETEIRLIDPLELHPNPVNVDIYGNEEVDQELVESIKELGQLDPIVITVDKIIISGHRRWLALKELRIKDLGIKAKCLYKHFKTKLDEKEAIIECNRQREKSWMQTCNEVALLKEIYAERAELRRLANLKQNANKDTEPPNSASREESGSTRDYIEKKSGVKHDKLSKMNIIITKVKAGDEIAAELEKKGKAGLITVDAAVKTLEIDEIAKSDSPVAGKARVMCDQVRRGDITPNKGWQQIKAEMKAEKEKTEAQAVKKAKIPSGVFNILLSETYPIADISNKKIPADEDSILFLWLSASSLPESLDLMKFWGYEYKSCAVLDKENKGSGSLFLTSHDLLLVGICGTGIEPVTKVSSVIHGKKHDCIYDIIEQMFPGQKYLELFKENKRDDWNVGHVEEAPQQLQQKSEPETETQTTDTTLQATTEKEAQEPIKPEEAQEPEHTVSGESQAPVATIEKQHNDTLDKPFILKVGSRDMGVIEEFNNHELNIALLCQPITKIQDKTELWDNKKNKLIFTFDEELSPDRIVRMADKEINKYLDAEEHLPPEPMKPEEAPQQPQPEHETEPVKAKTVSAKGVRKTKKDISQDNVSPHPKEQKQPVNKKKNVQQAKADELHNKEIRISYNAQKAIRENPKNLEELLISNNYDVEYEMESNNCTKLDRHEFVTDDMYNQLESKVREHGAKDINEVIIRLLEGSKKAKSQSKKKATDLINHQNTDNAPSNVI